MAAGRSAAAEVSWPYTGCLGSSRGYTLCTLRLLGPSFPDDGELPLLEALHHPVRVAHPGHQTDDAPSAFAEKNPETVAAFSSP